MKLYKFQACNSPLEDVERLNELLSTPYIWASRPTEFNDPFEFKLAMKWECSEAEARTKYFKDNPRATEQAFADWFRGLDENNKWYIAQQFRGTLLGSVGVSCFCQSVDNHLLWSHYARNHEGFCVEYEFPTFKGLDGLCAAAPVCYSRSAPTLNMFREPEEQGLQRAWFCKSEQWFYEQEFRLVFQTVGRIIVPKECLTSIYLGCRASRELRNAVYKHLGGDRPSYYQMCELPFEYTLRAEQIMPGVYFSSSFF